MQMLWDSARRLGRPLAVTAITTTTLGALAPAALAQPTPLTTKRVAFGLSRPLFIDAPAGDLNRLFIVEQRSGTTGRIRILDLRTNTVSPTPFLSVNSVGTGDEQGLLGLAFHPDYLNNGYFWINYTAANGTTIIRRYTALGDPSTATTADPNSATTVLNVAQPFANHNGGWMSFGPDGNLYIAMGDGGDRDDPGNRAQSRNTLLGKLLRIDVDGPDNIPGNADDDQFPADATKLYSIPFNNPYQGMPAVGLEEIWAYGLRNPWRCDFDPDTGNLFIADVGQDFWEEINFQPANGAALPGDPAYQGGKNYGWRCREGNSPWITTGCAPANTMVSPFLVYGHGQVVPPTNVTGCSISGGIVYRGCAIPDLSGTYFFSDLCNNRIFSARYDGTTLSEFTDRTVELRPTAPLSIQSVVSFGRDGYGEMYICDLFGGEVFKVVANSPYYDLNLDNAPDNCRCPADWDGSGSVNSSDISAFLSSWLESVTNATIAADYDRSGTTNSSDISAFLASWLSALTGGGC